jgi:hypothetical protein
MIDTEQKRLIDAPGLTCSTNTEEHGANVSKWKSQF